MADSEQEERIKFGQHIKGKGGGWKALHAHVQTSMILMVGNSQNLDTYHVSIYVIGRTNSPWGISIHLSCLAFFPRMILKFIYLL